jgi:hypothetical protein
MLNFAAGDMVRYFVNRQINTMAQLVAVSFRVLLCSFMLRS